MTVGGIEIKIRISRESIEEILPEWQELYDNDPNQFAAFLAPCWVMPWLANNPQIRPYFICVRKEARLIALLPMSLRRQLIGSTNVLNLASDRVAGYGIPILASSGHAELLEFVTDHLGRNKSVDLIQLSNLPAGIVLTGASWRSRQSPAQYSSVLNLGRDLENIGKRRSIYSRLHKEVRRSLKKLERHGKCEFHIFGADRNNVSSVIDAGLQWKAMQIREQGRFGHLVGSPRFRSFLLDTFDGGFSHNNNGMIFLLTCGGTPIAMAFYLAKNGTLFGHFMAYSANFQKYAPGNILIAKTFDWMKENSSTHYDFLGYPEPYKKRFSNETIPLYDYVLPLTWKGRVAAHFMRIPVRSWFKQAFYALPFGLRKAIVRRLNG